MRSYLKIFELKKEKYEFVISDESYLLFVAKAVTLESSLAAYLQIGIGTVLTAPRSNVLPLFQTRSYC